MSATLVEKLLDQVQERGGERLYTFVEKSGEVREQWSFAELDVKTRALAVALSRRLERDDRVLLVYPSGLDFVAGFFGCLYAGMVPVPAARPGRRPADRLLAIARDSRPAAVLGLGGDLETMRSRIPAAVLSEALWIAADAVEEELASLWHPPRVGGDDLAFLQYTSGSTSTPKGVEVTHRNLLANLAYIDEIQGNDEDSVGCSWLPSFHDMGLIEGVLQPVVQGYPTVLMSPLAFVQRPALWLRTISRYRATNSGGPNFAFDLCVDRISEEQREELDLSSWRHAYNGSEPIRASTLERFLEAFSQYGFRRRSWYPVYGLAEATLMVSSGGREDTPYRLPVDAGALGENRVVPAAETGGSGTRPIDLVGCGPVHTGHEVAIVDPDTGRRVEAGRVGEIWVAGPSVARGYWGRPSASEETFGARLEDEPERRWLRTGDLGFVENGELFVTGRLKDLVILGGRNHYPQDIESTVCGRIPDPEQCLALAFSVDRDDRERLVVVLGLAPRDAALEDPDRGGDLVKAVRHAVAEAHEVQVHDVVLVPRSSVPRTTSGKLRRRECRRLYLDGALARGRAERTASVARA